MSKPAVKIVATYADGKTLDEFSRVLAARQKYLNETAFQSIHAMMMETLRSIRGQTKVAKASSIKVDVKLRGDLQFSWTSEKRGTRYYPRMCIRDSSGLRLQLEHGFVKLYYAGPMGISKKALHVFEFIDVYGRGTKYLICATSNGEAKRAAKKIVARRLMRYAGLARQAICALMISTWDGEKFESGYIPRVYSKAMDVTAVRRAIRTTSDGSGLFALIAQNNLEYAVRAIKGGAASVDLALRRAANKSVGLIHHRCKDLLLPGELKTPFPEITKRGAA